MMILDTLSGNKKPLLKSKTLNMFVCGPTVYDNSHIGHARTYLAFDIIVRYLRHTGYDIFYLQNITDIDDKIIKRSAEAKKNPLLMSREFEEEYLKDIKKLGITSVDKYARASDHIEEIIDQVKTLIEKDKAYETDSGVYFKIREFSDYGNLSGQDIKKMKAGERIKVDETKKDPLDFVLWKKINKKKINKFISKDNGDPVIVDNEPLWDSPWGPGRPGWHIEDTAITESFFGSQYDIHGGAEDLKFPHHEAEIAQQESASGKSPFVNIWMHTGVLTVNGEKMSKSLGNFITIKDFLSKNHPNVLRWMVVMNHYRSRIDYNEDVITSIEVSLNSIQDFLTRLSFVGDKSASNSYGVKSDIDKFNDNFHSSMQDDFNTPKALASIFSFINNVSDIMWELSSEEAKDIKKSLLDKIRIFGIEIDDEDMDIPKKVLELVSEREDLRSNQQFIQSDEIRERISVLGYEIEDTPLGAFIKIKRTQHK